MVIHARNLVPSTTDRALGGSVIERSLRFDNDNNTYLNRTPSAQGDRRVFTLSWWMKCDGNKTLFSAQRSTRNPSFQINLDDQRLVVVGNKDGSSSSYMMSLVTDAVFRDKGAWYHCVVAFNTNDGTASNRIKIYVNGSQVTSFSAGSTGLSANTYPSSGDQTAWGTNEAVQNIGRLYGGSGYYDGYLAEIHYVDGSQLDASSFGYTESQTGIWRPKRYTGGYGDVNNGFHLEFKDNSSTSALGKDTSGNQNNFTTNNFSVTAGEGNDSVLDTPTKNWDTLNPLDPAAKTLTDGNLRCLGSTGFMAGSNFAVTSGKWYMEVKYISGTSNHQWSAGFSSPDRSYLRLVRGGDGELTPNTGNVAVTFADPDILMLALDVDNGKWYIGKNGSYMLSGDPVNGTGFVHSGLSSSEGFVFCAINNTSEGSQTIAANFGQQGFTYTPPTGFKAFNSSNLPPNVPSIIRPQKHFDTILYTGNDGSQTITGLEFDPDFVWAKNRQDAGYHHDLYDTVRGNNLRIFSSQNQGEATGYLQFGVTGGFSLTSGGGINANNKNHVAWCWKAGGAAVTNNDGNITSSVSVNEEAGFSIVSYTGNGSNGQTVGHGLSKAPQWIMLKSRTASSNWRVWQHKLASDGSKRLILDQTNASENAGFLNDTAPTSTVFTLGNSDDAWNVNSGTYIAYCWHEVPGFSKFGSYTGNGSADGRYVHLGFRPAWIMIKISGYTGNWIIFDNKRDPFNYCDTRLFANLSNADTGSYNVISMLSNGFKVENQYDGSWNRNNTEFVFMAFAEQPGTTPFETFPNGR